MDLYGDQLAEPLEALAEPLSGDATANRKQVDDQLEHLASFGRKIDARSEARQRP